MITKTNTSMVVIITVIIAIVCLGFLFGKKIGYNDGLAVGERICKYYEPEISPTPIIKKTSERSLKAAAWAYTNSSAADLNKMKKDHPELGTTPQSMIKGLAEWFDESPESLALVEADMKKAGD
jgi:hypothetical protein